MGVSRPWRRALETYFTRISTRCTLTPFCAPAFKNSANTFSDLILKGEHSLAQHVGVVMETGGDIENVIVVCYQSNRPTGWVALAFAMRLRRALMPPRITVMMMPMNILANEPAAIYLTRFPKYVRLTMRTIRSPATDLHADMHRQERLITTWYWDVPQKHRSERETLFIAVSEVHNKFLRRLMMFR